jgi:hypothetical protein
MNFGTWHLAQTVSGEEESTGDLHPLGICDLSRHLSAIAGAPSLVVDLSKVDLRLFDYSAFFGYLARVRNAGGQVVVVADEGPLTRFLSGLAWANAVPVVGSLQSAWGRCGTLASAGCWAPKLLSLAIAAPSADS